MAELANASEKSIVKDNQVSHRVGPRSKLTSEEFAITALNEEAVHMMRPTQLCLLPAHDSFGPTRPFVCLRCACPLFPPQDASRRASWSITAQGPSGHNRRAPSQGHCPSVEPAVLHKLAGLGDDKAEQEEGEAEAHGDAGHHLRTSAVKPSSISAHRKCAFGALVRPPFTKQRRGHLQDNPVIM